ncbi:GNAT family N-acetyltransferase [Burkholderia sp. WSM2232]|uniref:GNAT family N-acetyltransferase n=1 Tax=Burkholderia sp. WSM2232 TaxID=944436 RepID=UPI0004000337|nr:GNAT family N-acetyltransferase [Burkholderia sp. WSM2232]
MTTSNELKISSDNSELDLDMVHAFLSQQTPWAKGMPRETLERAIAGSLCFGGYVGGRQVAFARVVTDRATFAYLCDVFVLPEHRGKGYASALLAQLLASESLQGLRRIMLATTDAHHVYRPHGFKALSDPALFMEVHNPDVYTGA